MRYGSRPGQPRGKGFTRLAAALVWLVALSVSRASGGGPPGPIRFERDGRPILAANCAGCRGPDHPKADLDLRTLASILRGGKSGPAVNPSDPDGSPLLERIERGEMTPDKARKLSADEVATVRALKSLHHGREESLTDSPATHARVVHEMSESPAGDRTPRA
jgi:hypothetical protein